VQTSLSLNALGDYPPHCLYKQAMAERLARQRIEAEHASGRGKTKARPTRPGTNNASPPADGDTLAADAAASTATKATRPAEPVKLKRLNLAGVTDGLPLAQPADRSPHPSAGPHPADGLPVHRSRNLMLILAATAVAAATLAAPRVGLAGAAGITWAAVSVVYLVTVWRGIGGLNARRTKRHVRQPDPGRGALDRLLALGGVGCLVIYTVAALHQGDAQQWRWYALGGVILVALSWAVTNTAYTLRYARAYYGDQPGGGFTGRPAFRDFAYLAFGVGMSCRPPQGLTSPALKREAFRHSLVSYLLGAAVVASIATLVVVSLN
jgi:uncharacterized membrane protein